MNGMDKEQKIKVTYHMILQKISSALVIAVMFFLPLIYDDYYFNILETKYKFIYISVIVAAAAVVISGFVYLLLNIENVKKNKISLVRLKSAFTIPDICMLAFFLCAVISTIQSDYVFEAFWGNEGRCTGLFLLILYTVSFFLVSKFFVLKTWYVDAFLAVSVIVCLLGIADYFMLDLLGFKRNVSPAQYTIFTSTIGNVNSYAAFAGMALGLSMTLFGTAKKPIKIGLYYVSSIIVMIALLTSISDNVYLAFAAVFAFLPLYLFRSKKGILRYTVLIVTFFTVVKVLGWINNTFPDAVVGLDSIFDMLVNLNVLTILIVIGWMLVLFLWFWCRKEDGKEIGLSFVWGWLAFILLCAGVGLYILWDANVAENAGRYGRFSRFLVFRDDWGTHRGFIWRLAMEEFQKFPLIRKLFGYGPDTFGILMVTNRYSEMVQAYGEIYDSAHNEYIQYLLTIGITGLSSYILLLVSSGIRMVKRAWTNPLVMSAFFACLAYGAQAFVNINLPIVAPVMWFMLMIGLAGCRKDDTDRREL